MRHLQIQILTLHVPHSLSVSSACSHLPADRVAAGWTRLWPALCITTVLRPGLLPALLSPLMVYWWSREGVGVVSMLGRWAGAMARPSASPTNDLEQRKSNQRQQSQAAICSAGLHRQSPNAGGGILPHQPPAPSPERPQAAPLDCAWAFLVRSGDAGEPCTKLSELMGCSCDQGQTPGGAWPALEPPGVGAGPWCGPAGARRRREGKSGAEQALCQDSFLPCMGPRSVAMISAPRTVCSWLVSPGHNLSGRERGRAQKLGCTM